MPSVNAPATAVVTGANGYLGTWVAKSFLDQGYHVRGTIRTAAKGEELKRLFAAYGEKYESVIVKDVLEDGAFDEAVKGAALVVHTLSPVTISSNPDDTIPPAVQGTVGILKSAKKYQDTVKRVVVTGSVGCIAPINGDPAVYDESLVNELDIQEVEQGSRDFMSIYYAAKTIAEKKAWAFVRDNDATFDLVFIHGSAFIGPPAHPLKSVKETSVSLQHLWLGAVHGRDAETVFWRGEGWIDIRDIALAHVLAAQKAEAGGERIIVSAGDFVWQDLHDVAHAIDPTLPVGDSAAEKVYIRRYNNEKMKRVLGLEPRSLEETMRDSLEFYNTIPDKLEVNATA
ncbi:D-lactaldehyde dehydrogenase [Peniophora sp. CONT]|nr:D-lactaldehyde dehydrogenase [Peniophora sp. CONT]